LSQVVAGEDKKDVNINVKKIKRGAGGGGGRDCRRKSAQGFASPESRLRQEKVAQ